jgi:hypothetical protein
LDRAVQYFPGVLRHLLSPKHQELLALPTVIWALCPLEARGYRSDPVLLEALEALRGLPFRLPLWAPLGLCRRLFHLVPAALALPVNRSVPEVLPALVFPGGQVLQLDPVTLGCQGCQVILLPLLGPWLPQHQ